MGAGAVNPLFCIMGNQKYYHLLHINIDCIREVYPEAEIAVFDWGDARYRSRFTTKAANVTVIDWGHAIRDISSVQSSVDFEKQIEFAIRYNARFQRSLMQRIKKKILKTSPRSVFARPMLQAGLMFENMLAQKIPCMQRASELAGSRRMVFLDADAFLLQDLDDVLARDDFDVGLTTVDQPCFDHDKCAVVNSGVIFFGPDARKRAAFLAEWSSACSRCKEWLQEQTSVVRMLQACGVTDFSHYRRTEVNLSGEGVTILSLPQYPYNDTDHECLEREAIPRVAHLANTAHNKKYLEQLKAQLVQARARAHA